MVTIVIKNTALGKLLKKSDVYNGSGDITDEESTSSGVLAASRFVNDWYQMQSSDTLRLDSIKQSLNLVIKLCQGRPRITIIYTIVISCKGKTTFIPIFSLIIGESRWVW